MFWNNGALSWLSWLLFLVMDLYLKLRFISNICRWWWSILTNEFLSEVFLPNHVFVVFVWASTKCTLVSNERISKVRSLNVNTRRDEHLTRDLVFNLMSCIVNRVPFEKIICRCILRANQHWVSTSSYLPLIMFHPIKMFYLINHINLHNAFIIST